MKWLTFIEAVCAVSLVTLSSSATAQTAAADEKFLGNWQGQLVVTPEITLRITLEFTKEQNGSLSGKWESPDESLNNLPLESIALEGGVLTFKAKPTGAVFKGKLNESCTEAVGDWAQGGKSFPIAFKRFDPSKVVVAAIPPKLAGIWEGKLKLTADVELRLALNVEKNKDGVLKATLASPDQGANNIPISSIGLQDDVLTFESKIIAARFTGKKNKDQDAFEGEFSQGGRKLPLTLKKTDKITESARPQTPKPPFPYRAEEVSYENKAGGVRIAGTLTLPAGNGPFPAVILITGSGAQDRDESLLGHKPFLVLADYLTRRGIAVLRVDDRGVGGSTGSTKKSTSEDFAGDALTGLDFLRRRTEIDAKKIGLIGHSEGGLIAPFAAARSRDVAFIVLMAGTGLPGSEILKTQMQLILKADGASESEMTKERGYQKRLIDIIAAEKDEKVAETKISSAWKEIVAAMTDSERKELDATGGSLREAAIKGFNSAWFRYFLTYDPRPTLRKVLCPVLAINGEKDLQVSAKENLAEIAKALEAGGNSNVKTVEFPGLNHLFQPCKTGSPNEYASIEMTIAPEALKTIGDWIVGQTGIK